MRPRAPTLIKKYGNRRLYDTAESRYITLDELSTKVRSGTNVRVVDAKSGEDLTQATLTQIIIEGRSLARMLPVPLLLQLIRLGDDALAEFFGRWVTGALEVYLQAKQRANSISSWNPFAALPFNAGNAMARMWMSGPFGGGAEQPSYAYENSPPYGAPQDSEPQYEDEDEFTDEDGPTDSAGAAEASTTADELAALRREMEELKRSMRGSKPAPRAKSKPPAAKRKRKRAKSSS